ncbi:MAG: S8 family serine peptidase [Clostridium sp.]
MSVIKVESLNYKVNNAIATSVYTDAINARYFWGKEPTKGEGRKIAIISTGCNVNHKDLEGNIAGVRNFTSDDNSESYNVTDYSGDGTYIAGIIGANEASVYPGVAPNVDLFILKAISSNGVKVRDIIEAFIYAIEINVDVIITSLQMTELNSEFEDVVRSAAHSNISIIAPVGDVLDRPQEESVKTYPAAFNEVMCVGCSTSDDKPSPFNNINNHMDMLAPGEGIATLGVRDKYVLVTGSLISAAYAAGGYILVKNYIEAQLKEPASQSQVYMSLIRRLKHAEGEYLEKGMGILDFAHEYDVFPIGSK